MKKFNILLFFAILGSMGASYPYNWMMANPNPLPISSNHWVDKQFQIMKAQVRNIDDRVLRLSLIAYQNARLKGLGQKEVLTVIDYSKPSYEKRMWVFDLKRDKMLYNTWVSHGKNSGGTLATSFSNRPGSLKSSIGVFLTANPYMGGNGYSLRLMGLEPGINDNAYKRSVVIHGATYASSDVVRKYGTLGRSWGCPAVSKELSKPIINTIKESTLLFAYYPDNNWLSHSQFLTG